MSKLPNSEEAQTMDFLVIWYRPFLWERLKQKDTLENHRKQEQDIVFALEDYRTSHPKDFKIFSKKVEKFKSLTQSVKIPPPVFSKPPISNQRNLFWIVVLTLFAPITLFGLLNGAPAYLVKKYILGVKKEDLNNPELPWYKRIVFVYPVFIIIQTILVGYFSGKWWIALLYLILLPVCIFLTTIYRGMVNFLVQQHEYRKFIKDPNSEFMVLYREIVIMMDSVIKGWVRA